MSYWLEVILAEGVDDEGFVAGATGVIGKQLVPRLVEAGREVHGMTRSESKQAMLRGLGAVLSRTRLIPIRSRRPSAAHGRT
jgi:nucleoside-diphosphate-sugar epimerase